MSDRFRRGSTVAYGPHFGIVWAVTAERGAGTYRIAGGNDVAIVQLFPIIFVPRRSLATDVRLDLAELVAAGIERPHAVVRVSSAQHHRGAALRLVGELRQTTICRFVAGVAKAHADAVAVARWDAESRHRNDHAEAVPVNMRD